MRRFWLLPLAAALIVAAFVAGVRYGRGTAGGTGPGPNAGAGAGERKILYYHCPMHPDYKSDKPGTAPCCGMDLVPVYADGAGGDTENRSAGRPGTVRVPTGRQQIIGVELGKVERRPSTYAIRTVARVTADENRVFRLNAATECWIRQAYPPTSGTAVRRDEPLLGLYSPNFLSAANAYLFALNTLDRQKAAGQNSPEQLAVTNVQVRQAVESLQNLGVSDAQLKEMASARAISDLVTLRSPTDGIVLVRNATLGQYVEPGTELYQIADLSVVWVVADIFQNEARFVQPGQRVTVSVPSQSRRFEARVSRVLPQFDPTTRTLKVRIETDNPGYQLRPDMFVDVEFAIELPPALTVPVDALVDSGQRKVVFVDQGEGYFEPRRVEAGWRLGDRVEITGGLMEGESIVVSGNFLIDSESRMKAAAAGFRSEPAVDPVCGMDVDPVKARAAGLTATHAGRTYYFCAEQCKHDFEQAPAKYLKSSDPSAPSTAGR